MFVKQIVFIKDFTSPVFGNVYAGKAVKANAKDAEAMIEAGLAKADEKKKEKKDADKPKRSKATSKGGSE